MKGGRLYIAVAVFSLCASTVRGQQQQQQQQRNIMDPAVRKMILEERKGMNCVGIYEQTKLKLDAQFKSGNKIDASVGLSQQILATLDEVTTALGQSRRELCEFYKHDPEFTKDDYFRQVGELNKGESDAALLLQFASGKASAADLKTLQTVKPQASPTGTIDVNATLKEVTQTVDSVTTRISKAEERINALEATQETIATATATVEVVIATPEQINTTYADSGGYLMFMKNSQMLMGVAATTCRATPFAKDQVVFHGVFMLDATSDIVGKPTSTLKSADHLQIGFVPMKPKQHVIQGRAIVILNNAVRLEFAIPAQDMASNFILVQNIAPALSKLQ